ncbi:unnamed protein product [Thlaspi arvense]|uniref:Protein kinase domain-containing protein n=1 Tax=Thlaspi arvense TaxID=13288 RepID=A0AAU9RKA9_THLAR|nr:unnamed protein product [Thlaspi arvense]
MELDIKTSNILLDLNFNAKLGDFGLARLVDHEKGSQTTNLAGTMGYMAPESCITGCSASPAVGDAVATYMDPFMARFTYVSESNNSHNCHSSILSASPFALLLPRRGLRFKTD